VIRAAPSITLMENVLAATQAILSILTETVLPAILLACVLQQIKRQVCALDALMVHTWMPHIIARKLISFANFLTTKPINALHATKVTRLPNQEYVSRLLQLPLKF
jgi:hypothetical protein